MQREGEKTIGEVELAVPAAWIGQLDCVLDRAVMEAQVLEAVVEVARQVDDDARLLVRLDDDVQRLDAERAGVVVPGGLTGQFLSLMASSCLTSVFIEGVCSALVLVADSETAHTDSECVGKTADGPSYSFILINE